MKKGFQLILMLSFSVIVFAGCSAKKEPIDGKVSGAVFESVHSLIGSQPIGFDLNNMSIDWVKDSYDEIHALADPWLRTLKPTHEINKLPLKSYIRIYYSNPYDKHENIDLFIPYPDGRDTHKNIILKGKDNGMTKYYVFEGGSKETAALIEWMKNHAPS